MLQNNPLVLGALKLLRFKGAAYMHSGGVCAENLFYSSLTLLISLQQHYFETKQNPDQLLSAELEEIT